MDTVKQTSMLQTGLAFIEDRNGNNNLYPLFSKDLFDETVDILESHKDKLLEVKEIYSFLSLKKVKTYINMYGLDEGLSDLIASGYTIGMVSFEETYFNHKCKYI